MIQSIIILLAVTLPAAAIVFYKERKFKLQNLKIKNLEAIMAKSLLVGSRYQRRETQAKVKKIFTS